jgi:ADP-heptose:LPS heptosyltransferase
MVFVATLIDIFLSKISVILIFRLGAGIGDQVCMTAVVTRVAKAYPNHKIIAATPLAELYYHNSKIFRVIKIKKWQLLFWRILRRVSLAGKSRHIQYFENFGNLDCKNILTYAREVSRDIHMTNILSEKFYFDGNKSDVSPKLFVTQDEQLSLVNKFNLKAGNFAVIHSQGKTSYTAHKQWDVKKFQNIVDNSSIEMVQVGLLGEAKLEGCTDLRGKLSLRELCVLISMCRGTINQEGLYHHIAAAFNKPAITMYTFIDPSYTSYDSTVPVVAHDLLDCAPCFNAKFCQHDEILCSKEIYSQSVVELAKSNKII